MTEMVLILLTVLFLGSLLTEVAAYPGSLHDFGIQLGTGLHARQGNTGTIPNVPSQCKSSCDPVNTAIGTAGCHPATCCTSVFETNYFNCFECVGAANNITDYTAPQNILDSLVMQCSQAGLPISKLTLPGQNPSRTLSTLPVSSSTSAVSSSSSFSQVTLTAPPSSTSFATVTQITVTALSSSTTSAGSSTDSAGGSESSTASGASPTGSSNSASGICMVGKDVVWRYPMAVWGILGVTLVLRIVIV